MPNDDTHICIFSGATVPNRDEAINKGWIPDAWSEKAKTMVGPISPECAYRLDISDPNENRVKDEYDSEDLANKGLFGFGSRISTDSQLWDDFDSKHAASVRRAVMNAPDAYREEIESILMTGIATKGQIRFLCKIASAGVEEMLETGAGISTQIRALANMVIKDMEAQTE